jgi:glycine cleavage system H protein
VIPDDLRYTAEHEWVRISEDSGGSGTTVRLGITDYAQQALGDVVFVQLPAVGATVAAGDSLGEVESTKSVSDIYAPVAGTVTARNEELDGAPELINNDPYGEGWMVEITVEDATGLADLLDAAAYEKVVEAAS